MYKPLVDSKVEKKYVSRFNETGFRLDKKKVRKKKKIDPKKIFMKPK